MQSNAFDKSMRTDLPLHFIIVVIIVIIITVIIIITITATIIAGIIEQEQFTVLMRQVDCLVLFS